MECFHFGNVGWGSTLLGWSFLFGTTAGHRYRLRKEGEGGRKEKELVFREGRGRRKKRVLEHVRWINTSSTVQDVLVGEQGGDRGEASTTVEPA